MSRICLSFVVSAIVATLTYASETASGPDITDAYKRTVIEGNNTFAFELYAKLRGTDGNLFLSPYSISSALAMTYAGARGNTRSQMAEVLHFDVDDKDLHPTFRELNDVLNTKRRSYEIRVANALWGQQGYGLLDEFLDLTKENYGAGLNEIDFAGATEASRKTINKWVEKQTKDKIKDLLRPGVLTPNTRLVLTNAIYFKGTWASKFNKKDTEDSPFYVRPGTPVQVRMMYQKEDFEYTELDKFQILELPYKRKKLSMVILLPKRRNGLTKLENCLTADSLSRWMGNLRKQKVKVYIPRFKTTSEFSLGKVLASMGMSDAFGTAADFSGMIGKRDLFISEVIHKAFVDVYEKGTEAAAATAVAMEGISEVMMRPPPIPVFRADHPFIFLIRDMKSGSILFLGRIVNPLE